MKAGWRDDIWKWLCLFSGMKIPVGGGGNFQDLTTTTKKCVHCQVWLTCNTNKPKESRKQANLPAWRWDTPKRCVMGCHGAVACHQESASGWAGSILGWTLSPAVSNTDLNSSPNHNSLALTSTSPCLFFTLFLNFFSKSGLTKALGQFLLQVHRKGCPTAKTTLSAAALQMQNGCIYDEASVMPEIWLLLI